ncbi:uncharacterized protein LOC112097407 [Citrus clementina]|uniref:uncharacterized protein LOC112097407 n=1 Tax=Citrus clementina TaxID=85681 RepID=UPI000CED7575|nr:uncharacterized protein LOC112097407 [Citrus x clementina]
MQIMRTSDESLKYQNIKREITESEDEIIIPAKNSKSGFPKIKIEEEEQAAFTDSFRKPLGVQPPNVCKKSLVRCPSSNVMKLAPFNYGSKEVKVKYRSICFNVRDSNNPDLRRKILLGEVEPEKFVRMIPEEMARHKLRHEIGQIRERRAAKIRDKDDDDEEKEENSECDDAQ